MGSGFAHFMISTIKNNKRSRPNGFKTLKDKSVEYVEHAKRTFLKFDKKATPMQLKEIREKTQKKAKIFIQERVILTIILTVIIIYLLGFITLQ